MAKIATRIIMHEFTGGPSPLDSLEHKTIRHCGVKEAVFPFNMFPEVDPVLGPEMRSTGEVLGISDSFALAFYKSQEAAGTIIPDSGKIFVSVNDDDKAEALEIAREYEKLGFEIVATSGTCKYLLDNGVSCEIINKRYEGRPNVLDAMKNGEIAMVINTPAPTSVQATNDDSYIRKNAIRRRICYMTTLASARAAVKAIEYFRTNSKVNVKSLQEYHADIK